MIPDCFKPCITCNKLLEEHTPKEIHEHYGIEFLKEFLEERSNVIPKKTIDNIMIKANWIEYELNMKGFMRSSHEFFKSFNVNSH